MEFFKRFLLILILGVVILFLFQNFETISVNFFKWSLTLPKAIILLLIYVLGALSGGLVFSMLKAFTSKSK